MWFFHAERAAGRHCAKKVKKNEEASAILGKGGGIMEHFLKIAAALSYIDDHLEEPIHMEALAARHHFSPYYFHRLFSLVVGQPLGSYVRSRRLERACALLVSTNASVLSICIRLGFDSAPAFARAFRKAYGVSPRMYRAGGVLPEMVSAQERVRQFTNRLRGGILIHPRMIKQGALTIAGILGDGDKTLEAWQAFEALEKEKGLPARLSGGGYEIRLYGENLHSVHVGACISAKGAVDPAFTLCRLPASTYACFDVYVANGYTSENGAMEQWLLENGDAYSQRFIDGNAYVVEYYDERFHGEAEDSIVEIWLPVIRKG